jgi:hypothetical protein
MNKIFPEEIEIGSPKYFCCICQNYTNDNFFESDCGHIWCKKCHDNLEKYSNKCPLCREEYKKNKKISNSTEFDYDRCKFIFIISLVQTCICFTILIIGRIYYLLLFSNGKINFFEKTDIFFITTIYGTFLFSVSLSLILILSFIIYKILKFKNIIR